MPFTKNYNLYYTKIYRFVYRLSQSHQESEDITQDVFMSLHNEINKGKTPENTKSWLYKCALNRYVNSTKKSKRYTLSNDINQYEKETNHSFEHEIFNNQKKQIIKEAIKILNPQEQILINLYNDEFSYKEISDILDMKFTSVGKTLSRVIEKLTKQIKSNGHEELFEKRRVI